jgi:uncharacterized membrane protein
MDKDNKKKKFGIKKILIIILVIAIIVSAFLIYKKLTKKDNNKSVEEVKKEDVIQTKEFDYVLYDNKSDLYKDYFSKLKEELLKDVVNEEEYAKIISQLFVVDFYSLADKATSTDIGGLEFIYEGIKENFVLKASDTIYKYVQSNVYGDRKQELPKVTGVEAKTITKVPVTIGELNDQNGYSVTLSITYEKEMGYPKEVTLTLVHVEKKVFIVEVK